MLHNYNFIPIEIESNTKLNVYNDKAIFSFTNNSFEWKIIRPDIKLIKS